jgi:hypothetical protein
MDCFGEQLIREEVVHCSSRKPDFSTVSPTNEKAQPLSPLKSKNKPSMQVGGRSPNFHSFPILQHLGNLPAGLLVAEHLALPAPTSTEIEIPHNF